MDENSGFICRSLGAAHRRFNGNVLLDGDKQSSLLVSQRFIDALTFMYHRVNLAEMRTTLSLDQDIYQAAKALADASGENLGAIVSTLARKGLKVQESFGAKNGLPVFQVSADARVIPGGLATKLMAEEDR